MAANRGTLTEKSQPNRRLRNKKGVHPEQQRKSERAAASASRLNQLVPESGQFAVAVLNILLVARAARIE